MATQDQLRAHKENAAAALSRGALDEAAREFSSAIYLDPRDVMLRQRLGDLLARLGRKDEAVIQFQQVAGHHAAKGELLRAIAISRTILDLDPSHKETQDALASLYAKRSGAGAPKPRPLPASMRTPAPAPAQDAPIELDAMVDLSAAQRTPLFSMLDESTFSAVIEKLALKWVKAGEVIVREGEPGESMFVVVQGEVDVVRGEGQAQKSPQAKLGEGQFFGEMALVSRSPRLATVVAKTDGLLLEMDREALDALSLQHPGVQRVVQDFYRDRLLANLLAVSPIFRKFSAEERKKIAARFTLRSLPAGAQILEQDREGAGLFCLLRGQCQPIHVTADGVPHEYPILREGDVFGEISLLFGTLCTATVRTLTHVEVLELPAPAFKELVLPHKEVRELIDRLARERLSYTTDLLLESGEVMDSWLV